MRIRLSTPARTRAGTLALACAMALMLGACSGDDGGTDEGGGTADGSTTSTVTMVDFAFEPTAPVVAAGDVELVNDGDATHTFTVEGQNVDVEVEAGQTATASVDLEPGTYTLFCEFHRSQGMETTLTVQ